MPNMFPCSFISYIKKRHPIVGFLEYDVGNFLFLSQTLCYCKSTFSYLAATYINNSGLGIFMMPQITSTVKR